MTTTDLDLRGMSCASCAARVEGALNRLDGVRAAVNFALERAHVVGNSLRLKRFQGHSQASSPGSC
jgi:copper chaperone CopZ